MNYFKNEKWVIDYCDASDKGEIIKVPQYIRNKVKEFIK